MEAFLNNNWSYYNAICIAHFDGKPGSVDGTLKKRWSVFNLKIATPVRGIHKILL
jgi:hypothetical protein